MGPFDVADALESCLFCGSTVAYGLLGMNGFTMGLDLCSGALAPMGGLEREMMLLLAIKGGANLLELARVEMLGGRVGSMGIEICRTSFLVFRSAIGTELVL